MAYPASFAGSKPDRSATEWKPTILKAFETPCPTGLRYLCAPIIIKALTGSTVFIEERSINGITWTIFPWSPPH